MLDYLDRNRFDEVYKGPGDNFFGTLSASRPEIYPIYWSQAQMQPARVKKWRMCSRFSIVCGHLKVMESNGLTRM